MLWGVQEAAAATESGKIETTALMWTADVASLPITEIAEPFWAPKPADAAPFGGRGQPGSPPGPHGRVLDNHPDAVSSMRHAWRIHDLAAVSQAFAQVFASQPTKTCA